MMEEEVRPRVNQSEERKSPTRIDRKRNESSTWMTNQKGKKFVKNPKRDENPKQNPEMSVRTPEFGDGACLGVR